MTSPPKEERGLAGKVLGERWRFVKFCLVGGSGLFVNLGLVWLGDRVIFASLAGWPRNALVYLLGIVVSIFTNFLLNDAWTWRDRRGAGGAGAFAARLAKYYAVSAVAASLQYGTSLGSTALMALFLEGSIHADLATAWKSLAVLAGVAVGTAINFAVNHFWTYGKAGGKAP